MVLSLTLILSADIPKATIATDSKSLFGSKTIIQAFVSSCPPICGMQWQKSIDQHHFSSIDVGDSKHRGSSLHPKSPLLFITKPTFDDMQYYRLRVWNKIGVNFSNTLHLKVTGSMPPFFFYKNIDYKSVLIYMHMKNMLFIIIIYAFVIIIIASLILLQNLQLFQHIT